VQGNKVSLAVRNQVLQQLAQAVVVAVALLA
jgi:hypothetical protein